MSNLHDETYIQALRRLNSHYGKSIGWLLLLEGRVDVFSLTPLTMCN